MLGINIRYLWFIITITIVFRLTNPQMLSGIDTQNIISQYDSVYHKAMEALNVRSDDTWRI